MVLLVGINAKYIHTTLAVRSLQANAGKYRKDVEIAEYTINHRREEIFQDIYRRKPEAVGFSCYLWNIEYVMGLAGDLKKVLPNLFLFFGGPEVSYHPEEVLAKYEYADLVMVGEGERTFQEFMAYFVDGDREISSIDGIVYRGISGLHRTKPRQGLDMDDLVYPYDDMETLKTFGNKIYVDIEIRVDGKLTLWEAHAIAESVHDSVETEFSKVKHIMVHVNPC